ncbi:MAG: M48 family metalloprotease [Candidatus Liptonbacteria bacterium]|nr:M48 family metalloprotease [Candidatus Liptonbacteria bacterium]
MASLYTQQESNIRRTWLLFSVFLVVIISIGWAFSYVYNNQGILWFAVIFSTISSIISYWYSDKIALSMARAIRIEKKDNPQLYNIVENLSITAGLPMPRVYIAPGQQINAFATGRDPEHAAVAVTEGALKRLDKTELEGVLAHELSHVGNKDILVSTVAVILAGIISLLSDMFLRSIFWGGFGRNRDNGRGNALIVLIGVTLSILAPIGVMLIQLAISRRRESLADTSGVLLTRYPDGLISALRKIGADQMPLATARASTAHLWLDSPFKGKSVSWWQRLFMTHPPIQERINALEQMSM